MFSRILSVHKSGLTNVVAGRLLGATYVQRSKTTTPTVTADDSKPLDITDAVAVAEHRKRVEALLKEEMPKPYDGPERDHVNYPRRVRLTYTTPVRMGFLPDEWFTFFYKKTGVTGPYVFGAGLLTFLLSKEWYVIEEELSTGIALFILIYTAIKKFGPAGRKWLDGEMEAYGNTFKTEMDGHKSDLETMIEGQKKSLWQAEGQKMLMEAKRENVQMQLETEYRRRMMHVYDQVKKRLDYQMEHLNTKRKLEQKHMVDWIVNSVVKSITPQQEKDALTKCIDDLKVLSAQAH